MDEIDRYLDETPRLAARLPRDEVRRVALALGEARRQGRQIFLIGNGGSAATASHLANDLLKAAGCRAVALSDASPTLLAYGNDCGFETIFAEPLRLLAAAGDVLIALSGSGRSPNVLRALELARARSLFTVGLGGRDGGELKALCDLCVVVPSEDMEQIEDLHLVIGHALVWALRREAAR